MRLFFCSALTLHYLCTRKETKMQKILFIMCLLWTACFNAVAQNDSVRVSLLTVSPGTKVYELYGHTAIRVKEVTPGRFSDWVFNYGTFSFEQENFVWRFVKGETDYELGVVPYALFYDNYVQEARGIHELVLNLTPEESRRLVDALSHNLLPENATYRYNFFYDNCTTRAVDMIEKAIDGKIVWPETDSNRTLRNIVEEYADVYPWLRLGQNLLLGAEADEPAGRDAQGFAPLYAEGFVEKAKIVAPDGKTRYLVNTSTTLLPTPPRAIPDAPLTPMVLFGTLLAFTVAVTAREWQKRRYFWSMDALLLLAQGVFGLGVAFMFAFSDHPTVHSNWTVVLLNPLPLLYLPWMLKQATLHRAPTGLYAEAPMLLGLLTAGLAGVQHFPTELWLIAATLAVRCASFALRHRLGYWRQPA